MLTSTFQDLRYALRALSKNRNFTAAALLTLALGIGINTSIFTLLYSVAFRPLAVKDPESVVNVYQTLEGEYSRQVEGSADLLSYPEYLNYRDTVAGVSDLAASADLKLYLGGNNVERINGLMVTDNYFSLLGGGSALGRTFFDKECQGPRPQSLARRWPIVSGPALIQLESASKITLAHRTRLLASSPT